MAGVAHWVCFGVTLVDPATDPSATDPDSALPLPEANNDDHVSPRSSSVADEPAHSVDTTVTYNVTSESMVVSDGADDGDDDAARIIDCRGAQNVAGTWYDRIQF